MLAGETRFARRVAVVGEMLELGEASPELHRAAGEEVARADVSELVAVGGANARAVAEGAIQRGHARVARALRREQHGRGRSRGHAGEVGRCRARQRLARHSHRGCGRSSQGGVCLMLYNLLYQFHTQVPVLNVIQYITFRTAAASLTALVISLLLGPWLIRKLREFQIGQIIRHEGPGIACAEGRHADDGRAVDSDGVARADAAVGRSAERLHLDRRAVDGGVRRGRVHGRLSEDRPALASRPAASLQDARAGRRCAWSSDWR